METLDPKIVLLSKAIRQSESGGNPTAVGDNGKSYGAYQYSEAQWAKDSADAGVNVPLRQATLPQQNEVAYKALAKRQQENPTWNIGNQASAWNAGLGEPDAYKGTFSNGQSSIKKNPDGTTKFDVPAYAKSVATAYQQLKQGQSVGADPNNPSSTANQTPLQEQKPSDEGFLKKVQNVLTTIFPGTEQIGESLGTAAFNVGQMAQGKNPFENPAKIGGKSVGGVNPASQVNIPKTIGGYISTGSMVAAPVAGAETAVGRIATTAGLGALAGAGGAMAQGGGVGNVVKGGLVGGAIGGVAGGAGELLSKATSYLPQRLARTFLPGTSKETAEYAVSRGLGTPTKMLAQSDASLTKIGRGIETVLNDPAIEGVTASAQDVYPSIIEKFPNAGLTMENVGEQLKRMAPLQKGLIDKLELTGLNAAELNNLKTAIGENTYKMRFDEPAVKAGKDIGNAAYAAISDWLKEVLPSVRSNMPNIAPLFDEYTKELQLNSALQKAIRAGEKARPFTLRDIVAIMAGLGAGGPGGAVGAYALERGATNPSINLKVAGLVNRLNSPGVGGAARQGLVGLLAQNRGQSPKQ